MMPVDIQRVRYLKMQLDEINRLSIDDIEFTLDGVPVDVPQAARDRWEMTGLNNVDFVIALLSGDMSDLEEKMRVFMGGPE